MSLNQNLQALRDAFPEADAPQPALFVGHGNPLNAIEDNPFSAGWERVGQELPRPKAILCVSAHWETRGTHLTAMERPPTIHDFGNFPRALFEVEYPAPGSPALAQLVQASVAAPHAPGLTQEWGLDHGAWSVLCRMFPQADIPVVQLSLDTDAPATFHYALGQELAGLRRRGILIVASGNIVHNLRRAIWDDVAADWALAFDTLAAEHIAAGDHASLVAYESLGPEARLSIPTAEHYLPLLYALGARHPGEAATFFNTGVTLNAISMRSIRIG
jgi:4,5-DOPA dioxygenase extradiol